MTDDMRDSFSLRDSLRLSLREAREARALSPPRTALSPARGSLSPKSALSPGRMRSKRYNSLDSGYATPRRTGPPRSVSVGEIPSDRAGMNRLNFDKIDLLNTPLSSLRSCSEFNRYEPKTQEEPLEAPRSFLSSLFSWSSKKKAVRFRDSTEEIYMIERLRFHEETQDYEHLSEMGR
eukprot:CAMPEP_0173363308 /NCGR_PEP_ID=MMETSP1144-20121109/22310_1 /TAXON_ID=483371 /ORGANISM="non described non described, Strain CCMP2298" /LENGTH=177 /DNA_ID=CAMNT_0014313237 /DNA_START=136 /DNA_END=666 /DNA_ORIENTATION=+